MAKKCKCPEGVPDWIVTYGDMMSLLLCFFILLAAFSELKKDKEFQEVVQAIQEAFGYTGGSGNAPTNESPATSLIQRIEAISLHKDPNKQVSKADDPGVNGKQTTVKRVREGEQFVVGGPVPFEAGTSELTPGAMVQLDRVAATLRGKNNKVEIRGHASFDDLTYDGEPAEYWKLSNDRAVAVMLYLIDPRRGVRAERVRIVACANHEPLESRAYDATTQSSNRRVEVIEIEALVRDFEDAGAAPRLEAEAPAAVDAAPRAAP